MSTPVKCYAVHLPSRTDRYINLLCEFEYRDDLQLSIYPASEHSNGAVSLWLSIKEIIKKTYNDDFFILCEDDHTFTSNYNTKLLYRCINEGEVLNADMISGGVSWFKTGIQISNDLFWVERFSGLQFTIIFKRFYDKILNAAFTGSDQADYKISTLSDKKFIIHPFISVQKDFGYSDITRKNNDERRVERLFSEAAERLNLLQQVKDFYRKKSSVVSKEDMPDKFFLPLYMISDFQDLLPNGAEEQFTIIRQPITPSGNQTFDQWACLCNCINAAQLNEDDFFAVSFNSFELTCAFNKARFADTIITANEYNCEMILGDITRFNHAMPVNEHLFWIDSFSYSSFILLFAGIYQKILTNPPEEDEPDIYSYLSYLTSNKMSLYPFIVKAGRSRNEIINKVIFLEQREQLAVYQQVFTKYAKKDTLK